MKKTLTIIATVLIAAATPFFAHAGAKGGSQTNITHVNANSSDRYEIFFRAGEEACILVTGDGDTDLDLYVYDEDGDLVAYDDDYTDTCLVEWTPPYTQKYEIRIVNRGNVYNNYAIITN